MTCYISHECLHTFRNDFLSVHHTFRNEFASLGLLFNVILQLKGEFFKDLGVTGAWAHGIVRWRKRGVKTTESGGEQDYRLPPLYRVRGLVNTPPGHLCGKGGRLASCGRSIHAPQRVYSRPEREVFTPYGRATLAPAEAFRARWGLFHARQEGLGRAELQEEVEAYGDVPLVVGDVEADYLLVLLVLGLYV